jgi:5-methyltetrahydrofolate--homocysteine methyltransferase
VIEPSRKHGRRAVSAVRRRYLTDGGVRLPFIEALELGPLILDAGLGTRLLERGLDLGSDDPALWNLTHPAQVLAIHRRDVAAGSDAVLTNTFGANRFWLRRFGREAAVESINRRAVQLARRAVGSDRYVIGDIGPAAGRTPGTASEQAQFLVDAGVDALIFETYRYQDVEPVLADVSGSLAAPIPLLVSLWEWPEPAVQAARRLLDLGAAVIGMNCQAGIEVAVAFAKRMDRRLGCPLLIKPSTRGTDCADDAPTAFAQAVPRLVDYGVRLFGGCCGTSEVHVAALADTCARLDSLSVPSLQGGLP